VGQNDTELKKLGKRISEERKKRGLTIEKLAYGVGISKGNLSELERGMHDPKYSTMCAIADGLDIPISKLLSFRALE